MRFSHRAAASAAVFLGALILAAASAPGYALQLQNPAVQIVNAPEAPFVPPAQLQVPPAQPQIAAPAPTDADSSAEVSPALEYTSLDSAVGAQDTNLDSDNELNCLAIGVYYESKSEPLAGQLAVANVILNRTQSGRFPSSVCGVVKQHGQFSFVRGGQLPTPPNNAQWRKAVAVAKVAQDALWDNPVPEALYFHARYVRTDWGKARVASLGNHIFYR